MTAKTRSFAGAIVVVTLLVAVVWLLWGLVAVELVGHYWKKAPGQALTLGELGQVGDLFGGVNALFAAFAFGGVAIAAFYQHRTYEIQKSEADLNRQQHIQQVFEPLFFKLLDRVKSTELVFLPYEISEAADQRGNKVQYYSPAAVVAVMSHAIALIHQRSAEPGGPQLDTATGAVALYETLYDENEDRFGPYFRSLYHIFKLIDESSLPEDRKRTYAKIARASLSVDDLFFLLVNGGSAHGTKFKPLIVKYELLKHTRKSRLNEVLFQAIYVNDRAG